MPGGFGPRFLLEAVFLVLVAVVAGLADIPARGIILVMAAAWVLTAAVEWAASRERARAELDEPEVSPVVAPSPEEPATEAREGRQFRTETDEPLPETSERDVPASHVRVLPQEPDPAAQPVVERADPDPAALVGASTAPERPPPPPEPRRRPTPTILGEPPLAERVASEPPEPESEDAPDSEAEAEVEVVARPLEVAAALPPEPAAQSEPEPEIEPVRTLPLPATPREWNLWDLERLTRERATTDAVRAEEQSYLLMYLRDFATPEGVLPADFDGLVRESFGELLTTSGRP